MSCEVHNIPIAFVSKELDQNLIVILTYSMFTVLISIFRNVFKFSPYINNYVTLLLNKQY